MPQSTGVALGIGLESAEPTALLPRAETLPEPTGKSHLDLEKVKSP
jgi:X receptor alpha